MSAATCGITPLIITSSRNRWPEPANSEPAASWMRAPGGVEQPDHRDALLQRELAQAGDLQLAGHAHRAGHHREVVGGHRHQPAVDLAVAGDHAVGGRLPALHRALREVRPAVDAQLGERALVDQQRQALARGELVRGVLALDLLLAAALAGALAALVEVLDERAQRRARDERVGGRPLSCGHAPPGQKWEVLLLTLTIARQAVKERLEHVHRRLRRRGVLRRVVRRLEGRDLEAHQLAVVRHRLEQVVELLRVQAARRRELRREVLGVEHVEVEVHVHRRAVERVLHGHERLHGARPDHRHAAGARAASRSPSSRSRTPASTTRSEAIVSVEARRPTRRRRRPAPCRRGSRCRGRVGRVEVAVRVEPEHLMPGPWRSAAGSVVRPIEQSAASSTGTLPPSSASSTWPPASSRQPRESRRSSSYGHRARLATGSRSSRASTPRRLATSGASVSTPRTARGVRSAVRQRSATSERPMVSGPSSSAPASRRRPARPPGCPRW